MGECTRGTYWLVHSPKCDQNRWHGAIAEQKWTLERRFACHLMDAAAGAMAIARDDALFALAALLWHRHQLSWPLAMHLSMLS